MKFIEFTKKLETIQGINNAHMIECTQVIENMKVIQVNSLLDTIENLEMLQATGFIYVI